MDAYDGWPIVYTWHATSHIENEHGIITAYTGGDNARKLSALSNNERVRVAVAEIEKLFPGSSDLVENTATVAWLNEPYTRASYMALAPGEVTAHWKTLFEPAGRLFFAGEHATAIQGYAVSGSPCGKIISRREDIRPERSRTFLRADEGQVCFNKIIMIRLRSRLDETTSPATFGNMSAREESI
jgi:hypothetical protein